MEIMKELVPAINFLIVCVGIASVMWGVSEIFAAMFPDD